MSSLKENRKYSKKMAKLPFDAAAVAVFRMGVKNSTHFERLRAENKIPVEIPARPDMYYRDEWNSWKSFLETGDKLNRQGAQPTLRFSYDLLKATMRRLAITNQEDYYKALLDGRLPDYAPEDPQAEFPDEFEGWKLFLAEELTYVSFSEAKRFIRRYQLKNSFEWRNFCREGLRPKFIPSLPDRVYSEFTTWEDFLGYHPEV